MERFDADKVQAERRKQIAARTKTRKQILADQQSNANRDEAALEREREWYRKNGK